MMDILLPKAVLIDGLTQSAETWKVFEILSQGVLPKSATLVLFVTQANSITAVDQMLSRACQDTGLKAVIPYMSRTDKSLSENKTDNVMLVECWNARQTRKMITISAKKHWKTVVIVFDEADQGSKRGLASRLDFIRKVEKQKPHAAELKCIFITATVANLSKSVAVYCTSGSYPSHSILQSILHNPCVSHHFVWPSKCYIGPSWFLQEQRHLWKKLEFRSKHPQETKEMYQSYQQYNSMSLTF